MRVTFELELGIVEVECNYRWQLERAIEAYDPFQAAVTEGR